MAKEDFKEDTAQAKGVTTKKKNLPPVKHQLYSPENKYLTKAQFIEKRKVEKARQARHAELEKKLDDEFGTEKDNAKEAMGDVEYLIMKEGSLRPLRVLPTEAEAEAFIDSHKDKESLSAETRKVR